MLLFIIKFIQRRLNYKIINIPYSYKFSFNAINLHCSFFIKI